MKVFSIFCVEKADRAACGASTFLVGYGIFGPRLSAIHIKIAGCTNGQRKVRTEGMKGLLATGTRGLLIGMSAREEELETQAPPYRPCRVCQANRRTIICGRFCELQILKL